MNDIIFQRELRAIARNYDDIKVRFVISEPPPGYRGLKGFITAEIIRRFVGSVEGKTFYLCGPEEMCQFVVPELAKLAIPRRRIKFEACGPAADIMQEAGWPEKVRPDQIFRITVRGYGTIQARAGEPLLNTLERNGFAVPSLCRSGECGYCRMTVLSGQVFMPDRVAIRESDRWFNHIHACLTYPLSDLELRL